MSPLFFSRDWISIWSICSMTRSSEVLAFSAVGNNESVWGVKYEE